MEEETHICRIRLYILMYRGQLLLLIILLISKKKITKMKNGCIFLIYICIFYRMVLKSKTFKIALTILTWIHLVPSSLNDFYILSFPSCSGPPNRVLRMLCYIFIPLILLFGLRIWIWESIFTPNPSCWYIIITNMQFI